jgi:DMSO/TMAO reductase YedYZ molybdopterin-dependent catalytic subunit
MSSAAADPADFADDLPPGQTERDTLRVKHYGPVPKADAANWLLVFGESGGPEVPRHKVALPELVARPIATVAADLHCASGWTYRGIAWSGVPTAAVVERFPPPAGTLGVMVFGEYGYSANVRLADLLEPTSLLATHRDGEPLTPEHGYPVRLVIPHLYSWKGPKWFRGWEYLTSPRRGFWEERGYHILGDAWTEQRYSYEE